MLLNAVNLTKSIGAKLLFQDLTFTIMPGEKIALIGRNGHGKTTLLKILSGEDQNFNGEVSTRKNARIILTKQEHHDTGELTPLEYVLENAPNYFEYKKILDEYEAGIDTNLNRYLKTLEKFTELNYFNLEGSILSTLAAFNISDKSAEEPLSNLSGGEKRYIEMTKLMFSKSDLLLVDEPTNHMDYQGKQRFITWLRSLKQTVFVVTHDRDVLKHVTKIVEIKDKKLNTFKGNFKNYTSQNTIQTLSSVKLYADQLNQLKEAKKRMEWGRQMRAKSKQWKTRYDHWLRDYEKIKAAAVKPSFWIDQNAVSDLDKKVVDSYQKFKEKNININVTTKKSFGMVLMSVKKLALGYKEPVFENLTFSIKEGQRLFIKGKNGAGKSTLVKTILSLSKNQKPQATVLDGNIKLNADLRIGEYEQEIDHKYLDMTLEDAVRKSYEDKNAPITDQQVYKLLAQYLFNPRLEGKQKIRDLSGGQKARFQLIKMFVGDPNLLILDEPTNHLDLPSIEELENSLTKFSGGILYISHDTYFIKKMGGDTIEL